MRTGKILSGIYPKVTELRKLGSAGLETAWVAAERWDAYFTTKIEPWDVAAEFYWLKKLARKLQILRGIFGSLKLVTFCFLMEKFILNCWIY